MRPNLSGIELCFILEVFQQEKCLTWASLIHHLQPVELITVIGKPAESGLVDPAEQRANTYDSMNKIGRRQKELEED